MGETLTTQQMATVLGRVWDIWGATEEQRRDMLLKAIEIRRCVGFCLGISLKLGSLFDGNEDAERAWMQSPGVFNGASPIETLCETGGFERVRDEVNFICDPMSGRAQHTPKEPDDADD